MMDLPRRLSASRPALMGILNRTPDSFSDGGQHDVLSLAVSAVRQMMLEGAELIDVGGESTRPGADPVDPSVQLARVCPLLDAVVQEGWMSEAVGFSIDTRSATVAEAALSRGCVLVNDVSAGQDPEMFDVVAAHGASIVLMHMQGEPKTMQNAPHYPDVVREVRKFLEGRVACARERGIPPDRIILDPGIGFGKTRAHNLALIRSLDQLVELGYPVLLGCSRKRFMGAVCGEENPAELLGATVTTTVLGLLQGVKLFRVHDVRPNRQAIDLALALKETSGPA